MSDSPPPSYPNIKQRSHSGAGLRAAVLDQSIFDPHDPVVKHEIIRTIIQYLQDEGYTGSSMIVQDETNVKLRNIASKRSQLRRMKRAILDGEWPEVERLLARTTFKSMKAFRYAVHRQQFLELIEAHDFQKAFSILQRRLKELEAYARTSDEFRDMCYLLTCKSVVEAPSFRDWDGVAASRTALVEQYSRLLEFDNYQRDGHAPISAGSTTVLDAKDVPPRRLLHLLQQALAFQIGSSRHLPEAPPHIGTILEDYEAVVIPNRRMGTFVGHEGNVKCATFLGEEGCTLASGSSDNTVRIWQTSTAKSKAVLRGHKSRIWDISATANGKLLASASGDSRIRIWDTSHLLDANSEEGCPVRQVRSPNIVNGVWRGGRTDVRRVVSNEVENVTRLSDAESAAGCRMELSGHSNDVYAVRFHPDGNALVAGGYDRIVRLYDTETGSLLKTFSGHKSSISSIAYNARGNVIITGSKDSTIKFWDIISGLCIKTMSSHLGEVTSVETNQSGTLMLSSSKDNSNRLWDLRTTKAVRRFKGHQNTSKNFIRTRFGPREKVVVGGSEDGFVYIWDLETTDVVGKLGPAQGPVYGAKWNARQSVLASCNHDGVVVSWGYDGEFDNP
eukprot:GFKZ01014818.1.p1 GENE.GFKZ01014818.1~~GFKZ01014818.1.p1  ORF type:complete len:617 (-),score=58.73 GFKZ01014818.1:910-2760(-)